jgi:hypothetical protein
MWLELFWEDNMAARATGGGTHPPCITESLLVVCCTDHHSIVDLVRHLVIENTSTHHAVNKKLIRAMEYISQFNMRVLHKSGKDHVIPDALSRLKTIEPTHDDDARGQLEDVPDDTPEQWVLMPTAFQAQQGHSLSREQVNLQPLLVQT